MRHQPWCPGLALLAGLSLGACQDRTEPQLADAGGSLSRIPDSYDLIEIGALAGDNNSYPMTVNNRGQVTGMSMVQDDYSFVRGFYWDEDEGITDLGTPPGYTWVWADDINDNGLIAGSLYSDTGPSRAFVWDNGDFNLIEPPQGGTWTEAYGLNRDGLIVGATDFTPGGYEAFLLSGGEFMPLGVADGGTWSVATAINRRGDIIGFGNNAAGIGVGLLWVDGGTRMIDLSTVLSVPDFIPYALARGGQLAGYSPSLGHGVLVEVGGQTTELQSLEGPGGYSAAFGINRSVQVVGTTRMPEGNEHAFIWEDGEMVDLNDRIDPGTGVELTEATSISNSGAIAVVGLTEGEYRAFLLRPR